MGRHIVLLRGINLGAAHRVAMKELRERLEGAGYREVSTLLQSGNVVLAAEDDPATLEAELAPLLRGWFGFDIPVVARSRDELAAVVAGDPFAGRPLDPKLYQVSFLSAEPDSSPLRALEAAVVAPEELVVVGREIYTWHPNGIARSALAKQISARKLGVEVTARNWRTVTTLLEMADG
ncbi:MAG TPA: DUF1697 domain-containing protein [Pseudonocardia sp.]|nr:DUF1697 domain-containing protein [Pseudonocardia sp.]